MIVKKTGMENMPSNCLDCTDVFCNLPLKKGYNNNDVILKRYTKKRHENCSLIDIKEDKIDPRD
jgi:hypothetical protein